MSEIKRILVIDDEFPIREVLVDFLGSLGYDVRTAVNGQEGLDVFKSKHFDVAIIDISMPVMDGIECSREIKKMEPDFPIVIISGFMKQYSKEEIQEIGIQDILDKPLDILKLHSVLMKYIN